MHASAFVSALLLSAGTAVAAQMPPATQSQVAQNRANGADQVICEKQEDTGTRLGSHKICHTRSQWEQMRRDDRSATEHVQMQRSMDQNGH